MRETAAGAAAPDTAVRGRLLASATALFNRKGYAAATVREIVADAGVTKPVLYYYFRNKEGIFLELMGGAFAQFDAVLDESIGEAERATTRLLRLADRVYALFADHLEVARLMYSIYYGPPQGAPFFDFDSYHLRFQEAVRRVVEAGIRAGELRKGNADDATWAVIGAINVAMELHLCHPEKAMGRAGLERVLNVIFEGIAAEGRPGTAAGTARAAGARKGDRK